MDGRHKAAAGADVRLFAVLRDVEPFHLVGHRRADRHHQVIIVLSAFFERTSPP